MASFPINTIAVWTIHEPLIRFFVSTMLGAPGGFSGDTAPAWSSADRVCRGSPASA
jgi:hypothetical protein